MVCRDNSSLRDLGVSASAISFCRQQQNYIARVCIATCAILNININNNNNNNTLGREHSTSVFWVWAQAGVGRATYVPICRAHTTQQCLINLSKCLNSFLLFKTFPTSNMLLTIEFESLKFQGI